MCGTHHSQHPPPLELTFPADPAQLAPVRTTLRSWLQRCGLSRRVAEEVLVAAGEACANAIEHGLRHAPGRIRLTADASVSRLRLTADASVSRLRLTVRDTGRWKPARPAAGHYRGHGITVMRAVMNRVDIRPGTAGTTVDMQLEIG
ncbi:MAG TPA: ATP-binding protein [Streptosporangiaceae bacterium]|nr:ATP-binding protein [Streptosporangiaceae bacterium]